MQTAVYLAVIAACGYAWSTSTGYAPTGRQIIDGISDDISALLNNRTWLSGVLSLASVAAASFGILTLAEPFQYFQPEAFRYGDLIHTRSRSLAATRLRVALCSCWHLWVLPALVSSR